MSKNSVAALAAALCVFSGEALALDNRIDTIRSDAPELAPYGRLAVGVKTLKVVNPRQLDIINFKAGEPLPVYARPLTLEVWYPAKLNAAQTAGSDYQVMTRDGKTMVTLKGRAVRNAPPQADGGPYPLLIISHGYPGNRFLLSHLGENLASKGYVVASIDHTDSTYSDQAAFGSTLLNRPLDQLFVLGQMAELSANDPSGTLKGLVNTELTGLIGYSMGGYGVLNTIGGGFTAASVALPWGTPGGALAVRQAGNPAYLATLDSRIKAAVVFAPWGWNAGFWDSAGLAAIKTPVFFVAGSVDDVSGYAPGVRNIFEATVSAPRFLLTYENANHNAGAPIPAPLETWLPALALKFNPAEHYADAVWDSARMNNIAQHFTTAFLDKYLKNDASMDAYLKLVENAKDGKWSADADGRLKADHSYWKGFPKRSAVGLRLEHRQPE
jgi:predicted dienelactone hydrolase